MLNILNTNLYIDGIEGRYKADNPNWAVVHATQSVHYDIMGWDRRFNKPPKNHPNYILYEDSDRLSLNWVDGDAFLYNWSGPETFTRVLDFIDRWYEERDIMIHCDQGQSRAPTVAMLYLAKRLKQVPDNHHEARQAFTSLYPSYISGGIGRYVADNWYKIR